MKGIPWHLELERSPSGSQFEALLELLVRKRARYPVLGVPHGHTVAFPLRKNSIALIVLTRATSGPVVVDGESFLDALFASAGQG